MKLVFPVPPLPILTSVFMFPLGILFEGLM
jgi:hypothetical protein